MANRQTRDPGQIRRFDEYASIGEAPDYAVDTGQAWRALAQVAGGLSDQLGRLAAEAAEKEGLRQAEGAIAAARSGAAYLQQAEAQRQAKAKAGGRPGAMIHMRGDIRQIVSAAAQRYGVDPNALLNIAAIESSGNPNARNPNSSAGGLFQFVDATARQYGLKNRFDPAEAADAAARLARDNAAHLRKVLGREPTAGELYLAHQQGAGGAARLLANPGGDAVATLGADAVRLNGGRAGMTNAEFARLWTSRVGGAKTAPGSMPAMPVLSLQPLPLRRDGTISGEAYDRAVSAENAWRVQKSLETQIQAASEQFSDDPDGLAGRLAEIHGEFAKNGMLADPQIAAVFERRFVERSQGELIAARAKAETRQRASEQAAAYEGMAAQRTGVERQAMQLGAAKEGDTIIQREVERGQRAIDASVAAGTLTPLQGVEAKQKLAEAAATGRVRGVYDALATPEEKEAFATGLLEDWTAGKGPIAKLPYETAKALSETLWRDARDTANRKTAAQKVEAASVEQMIADDVASIKETGQGLDPKESGLEPARVMDLLGEEKFAKWQADRGNAAQLWSATSGIERESEAEIAARLAALKPPPGAPDFAERQKIYEAASRKAEDVLKKRADDPLGQATRAGMIDLKPIDPSDPDTLAQSLAARKAQAEQVSKALDTPVPLFRPEEVRALKGSLNSLEPARHAAVMAQLDFMAAETGLDDVRDTFGDKAVEKLQDWQARLRYATPEETAAFLKEKSDPQWQERVKPLVARGESEARKIPIEQIVTDLNTNGTIRTAGPVDTDTQHAMMNDYVALVGERYAVTQDMGDARRQAVERMHKAWGVTSAYGTLRGRLMPYPPERSYPPVAGSHDWLAAELADVAKTHGVAMDNLSLVADEKTKAAADRGERPGYLLSVTDPKTGLDELVTDGQGRPLRHFFDPEAAQANAAAAAAEARRTQQDPWLVLGPGTAIGPFYPPWRPATAADMKARQQRIEEIAGQREKDRAARLAEKRRIRAVLREQREKE